MIEVEVYNASRDHNLGFFQLNVTLNDGSKIPLNPAYADTSVKPLQTQKIRFSAPKSVIEGRKTASLQGKLFECRLSIKLGPPIPTKPGTPQFDPTKPLDPSPEQIRRQEIYDNCIIDLMPDQPKIQPAKKAAIKSKCKRISKNPSFLENLKY